MALIKCKECGHEISDKAKACPSCGMPNPEMDIENVYNDFKRDSQKEAEPANTELATEEDNSEDAPPLIEKDSNATNSAEVPAPSEEEFARAKKLAKAGFSVCIFLASFVGILVTLALTTEAFPDFAEPIIYVLTCYLVIAGIGILRYSRIISLMIFITCILNFVSGALITLINEGAILGSISAAIGLPFSLVVLYLLFQGVRGSFLYHRLKTKEDLAYKPKKGLATFFAIFTACLALLFFLGIAAEVIKEFEEGGNTELANTLITENDLTENEKKFLVREGIILQDEKIKFLISDDLTEEGLFLTDSNVGIYITSTGGAISTSTINVEEITDFGLKADPEPEYTIIEIYDKNSKISYRILTETGLDKEFYDALYNALDEKNLIRILSIMNGDELSKSEMKYLTRNGIIDKKDTIKLFYSDEIIRINDEGNILTEDKVISYLYDEELEIYEILLSNIKSVELVEEDEDKIEGINLYEITNQSDESLVIFLPIDDEKTELFISALKSK